MKLSIVVAAYNVAPYITRCLDSLAEQTIEDYEILVINDGSTDGTPELVKACAARYPHIVLIDKKENEGLSEARNTGLAAATGTYVAFVDGDDFVERDTYRSCWELAEATQADEVVFESVYDKSNGEQMYMPVRSSREIYATKEELELFFKEKIGAGPKNRTDYAIGFAPWGRMYRRSVLEDHAVRFVSEHICIYEDLMFALCAAPYIRKAAILHRAFYHYCENGASVTKKVDVDRYERVKAMCVQIEQMEIYQQYAADRDFINRYHRTILGYIRLSMMQLGRANETECMRKITRDALCRRVLQAYPIARLPLKQRVFAFLLKYRCNALLYALVKLYR
jgi:glycosyltransferase involved in cell wall biosynthesis